MTKKNKLKGRARALAAKTGMSYQAALQQLTTPASPPTQPEPPQRGRSEFHLTSLRAWSKVVESQTKNSWTSPKEIAVVLNQLGRLGQAHLFFPTGGGLNMTGARVSIGEPPAIDIPTDGSAHILRAKRLTLNVSSVSHEWTYFALKADKLLPTGIYGESDNGRPREELCEVSPGEYLDRSHWDENFLSHDDNGYEVPLPKGARVITRWFSGDFVIFLNTSIYNRSPVSYDGLHAKIGEEAFRSEIEKVAKQISLNA